MSSNPETPLPSLPNRPADGHKGTFGRVLIVAGSRGMSGAACLAGLGALRSGAGLVTLAVPDVIADIVAALEPSYLVRTFNSDTGRIADGEQWLLHELAEPADVVAIGPGLGRSEALDDLVSWAYTSLEGPLVLDADALNVLSEQPELLDRPGGPRVLTPHPGEFARLTASTIEDVQGDRVQLAKSFAERCGTVLVLKGQGTVVTDGTRVVVNTTGNSGMATGGTGDVLTGVITALIAQGMEPFEAAHLGVHAHGLAGDLAAEELSGPGLISSDLPRCLAKVWSRLAS